MAKRRSGVRFCFACVGGVVFATYGAGTQMEREIQCREERANDVEKKEGSVIVMEPVCDMGATCHIVREVRSRPVLRSA